MKIALGADHRGFALKQRLIEVLREWGWEPLDLGGHSCESSDYPDFARPVANAVASGEARFGVLICGTGIGMSIAANRIRGIRAARVDEPLSAIMARDHNDANVLCMGADLLGFEMAVAILKAFIETPFSDAERHNRRVGKIEG
ncbi:MAG: ribose 5-phosphate isomerase B [Armatimonadetes bacterium]|nr:ribose 5-phosphate isomerase B [Armatimonadota bacterium]